MKCKINYVFVLFFIVLTFIGLMMNYRVTLQLAGHSFIHVWVGL